MVVRVNKHTTDVDESTTSSTLPLSVSDFMNKTEKCSFPRAENDVGGHTEKIKYTTLLLHDTILYFEYL